jgi:hypothetical protein
MVEVKVLYEDGEEEQAKEILRALEQIHRKRFFFSWMAYEQTRGMLEDDEVKPNSSHD